MGDEAKPNRARQLIARAKRAGHDPLGFAADVEQSVMLANRCRQRFFRQADCSSLFRWRDLLLEIGKVHHEQVDRQWLEEQWLAYSAGWALLEQEAMSATVRARTEEAAADLPERRQQEILTQCRIAWAQREIMALSGD